jgi:glycosyltransferase involved in cell wall biosynthesis
MSDQLMLGILVLGVDLRGGEEPLGIVMAEAMACGTPVLGLARGAVVEVVEHGRDRFCFRGH